MHLGLCGGRVSGRPRNTIHLLQVTILLVIPAGAGARAEESDLRIGPHFFVEAAAQGPLEYREIFFTQPLAYGVAGGASYRGFSVSAWHGKDVNSSAQASEAAGFYSYKLPLLDLHLGGVWCSVTGGPGLCKSGGRIGVTTNSIRRTLASFTFDQAFTGGNRTYLGSVQRRFYAAPKWTVDLKLGGGGWNYAAFTAKGISLRVQAASRLSHGLSINYYWGILASRIERTGGNTDQLGPIAGSSFSWSF